MKIITIALLFQFLLSCWPKVNITIKACIAHRNAPKYEIYTLFYIFMAGILKSGCHFDHHH